MEGVEYDELLGQEEDEQRGKYLTFLIGEESFGIEIRYVTEIISIQPIIEVPDLPEYIKGIINLRGKIIPILEVRRRFNMESGDYDERTCIIVVNTEDVSVGLVVDCVSEVLAIAEENMSAPPALGDGLQSRYIKEIGKVGKDVKLIIDCGKLLNEEDKEEWKGKRKETAQSEQGYH